jgi:UDP-N-acetylmuramoyl-L-alanyl-D-glutamate--2,6-diaminopimelate ligase
MEAYAEAKALLFARPELKCAILNQDDAYSQFMQQSIPANCQKLLYGFHGNSAIKPISWETTMTGSALEVDSPWGKHQFEVQLIGRFNVMNCLAVFSSLMASGVAAITDVIRIMPQLKASPGRMEMVSQKPCVVVDYAHTPDALQNALETLSQLKPKRLWVIFGCGGDRDKCKRPIMGRIATQYADQVIVTNDNPRTEEPLQIIQDILEGVPRHCPVETIADRRDAIEHALNHADDNDIVLIAGKGHETYQIIGRERLHFSDQAVVQGYYTKNEKQDVSGG